jgi:hypothetical protein
VGHRPNLGKRLPRAQTIHRRQRTEHWVRPDPPAHATHASATRLAPAATPSRAPAATSPPSCGAQTCSAYTPGPEHVGGVTIVRAPDRDEAVAWGKKLAAAVGLPVEVRGFQG